jgi:sortase (surface protein transpeptidase)
MLTLTTCHPPGSNSQRLIVRAELVSSEIFKN